MLRARQKIGKYRITSRISSGPLADVYRAYDTIQKIHVALKLPKLNGRMDEEEILHEVQVATRLKHPNILSILNASYIDEHFVIAMEAGEESLYERLERRITTPLALDLAGQGLAALAYAHSHRIIHCDIKPENFILFPGNQMRLGDFGFAKLSLRTLKASGSGTIDYIAPEQAMGRPKFQSDVFSMGLVLYRMLSGVLPEWPYEWPLAGYDAAERARAPRVRAVPQEGHTARPEKALSRRGADAGGLRTPALACTAAETVPEPQRIAQRFVVASTAVAAVPAAVPRRARDGSHVPALRGPGRGEHAVLPLVRVRPSVPRLRVVDAVHLSSLRARSEEGLGLLRLVLRAGLRAGDQSPLCGQALHGPLQQQALPRRADAVHALLPLVPHEGAPRLETAGQPPQLQGLRLGHRPRILELLCLVPGARAT